MSVSFSELDGSPRISYSDGKIQLVRELKCAWSDSIAFFAELVGGYQMVGGSFVYTPPAAFPGIPFAVVDEVEIVPFLPGKMITPATGLSESTNQYEFAKFTANYRIQESGENQPRFDMPAVPEGTRLTYNQTFGAEFLTVPGNTYVWYEDGKVVSDDVGAGILLPTQEIVLTWENVPAPPWQAIARLSGLVADADFLGYGAEQVLFVGANSSAVHQLDRSPKWTLDYAFKVRSIKKTSENTLVGWNHLYRKEGISGEHWLAVVNEDVQPMYQSGNLLELFQFEAPA